jgi:hypothetical protein
VLAKGETVLWSFPLVFCTNKFFAQKLKIVLAIFIKTSTISQ